MPKRVLDGEGVWRSDKLARVKPLWVRAEYANLLPLALANGVFEANPRRVWVQVYAYNRPDVKLKEVEMILDALSHVGLLFRWADAQGKVWAYWIGIDKPGRLPGKSRRGRNEVVGPDPPVDELRKFLESNGIQKLPGFGFGSGSGLGSGELLVSEAEASDEKVKASLQTDPRKQALEEVSRELAELLSTRILENNPKSELGKPSTRKKRVQKWSIEIERMIQVDGENPEEVRQLIEFTQRDAFWCTNILSAGKLREKRDQLRLKMQREGRNHATPGSREQTGNRGNGRAQPLARSQQEPPAHRKRSVI